jgi:tetratricopeptide (TPR) repeat protein
MKQMIESPLYKTSPLVAGALRRLADAHWDKKEFDQAVAYWRQTVKEFRHINDTEATGALNNLAAWYILTKDYVSYENVYLDDDASRQDPAAHRNAADFMYRRAYQFYLAGFERKKPVTEKELAAEQKALYDYLASTKPWWVKGNDTFGYYSRVLVVLVYFHKDKAERDKVLQEALAWIGQQKDKAAADQMISQLCDTMRQGQLSDRARICVAALTDRTLAAWKEHEILCDERKWKEALVVMEQVEASTGSDWANRAMNERARIYKDALAQYDKAITLYERINNPPSTLWQIQDAYHRWGKMDKALTTLTELENLFPDQAPKAIWHKATYYKEMGDKKRAMAQAHRLMKGFPKAPEVSAAHLMCVAYGEPNFGGQTDDDTK